MYRNRQNYTLRLPVKTHTHTVQSTGGCLEAEKKLVFLDAVSPGPRANTHTFFC